MDQGYRQTSRQYGMLARLPLGLDGRTALYIAAMKQYRGLRNEEFWKQEMRRWVDHMTQDAATGQFLRVYAPNHLRVTVAQYVLRAFHSLGGQVA
jgi:hypothetical protein